MNRSVPVRAIRALVFGRSSTRSGRRVSPEGSPTESMESLYDSRAIVRWHQNFQAKASRVSTRWVAQVGSEVWARFSVEASGLLHPVFLILELWDIWWGRWNAFPKHLFQHPDPPPNRTGRLGNEVAASVADVPRMPPRFGLSSWMRHILGSGFLDPIRAGEWFIDTSVITVRETDDSMVFWTIFSNSNRGSSVISFPYFRCHHRKELRVKNLASPSVTLNH